MARRHDSRNEANLVYRSSWTAVATERNPVSKTHISHLGPNKSEKQRE